ncbi:unnamed protein product [Effrenium voratum]|uniref:Uncharacterized protein n=1 Tax=Effrenium voratum TaxID=2562239 RepID=A0AA36ITD4_9DINO|nr:unnamed protein product [Effrenium voratum]
MGDLGCDMAMRPRRIEAAHRRAPTPFATKAVAEGLEAPSEAGDELGQPGLYGQCQGNATRSEFAIGCLEPSLTQGPRQPVGADGPQDILGLPPWALAGILVVLGLLCLALPLLYWFWRQSNLRKEYIPREPPNVQGFVHEVVREATASGTLQQSRLGRS